MVESVRKSIAKIGKLMSKTSNKSNKSSKLGRGSKSTSTSTSHDQSQVDDEKINNLYIKEWEEVERAKSLKLNDFVSLACQSIHIILLLNYQSVSRFKRSKSYGEFVQTVNLQSLIEKYGDKGVFVTE
eukprot:UN12979